MRGNRLDDETIAAGGKCRAPSRLANPAAERCDEDPAAARPFTKLSRDVTSVHIWQSQIEDDHVGKDGVRHCEGFAARMGNMHLITAQPCDDADGFSGIRVIIDD